MHSTEQETQKKTNNNYKEQIFSNKTISYISTDINKTEGSTGWRGVLCQLTNEIKKLPKTTETQEVPVMMFNNISAKTLAELANINQAERLGASNNEIKKIADNYITVYNAMKQVFKEFSSRYDNSAADDKQEIEQQGIELRRQIWKFEDEMEKLWQTYQKNTNSQDGRQPWIDTPLSNRKGNWKRHEAFRNNPEEQTT